MGPDHIHQSLIQQATSCEMLGSPVYARILRHLASEYLGNGLVRELLEHSSSRPIHDAIPLRLLGAVHRGVLEGQLPELARHYPSVGGTPTDDMESDFMMSLAASVQAVKQGLDEQVQTNEVGRSVVLLGLSHWLAHVGVQEFDLLEIGSSAGLNLCFERFEASTGSGTMGTIGSAVSFDEAWFDVPPPLHDTPAKVIVAEGCDSHPIDVRSEAQRTRLLSFVWPDQATRLSRLRAAIDIAHDVAPKVTRASADTWLEARDLNNLERTTVVFHSIVWQYLGDTTQNVIRTLLDESGRSASPQRRLIWARMEPAGATADLRVTVWDGTTTTPDDQRLALVGYHGQGMRWEAGT